MDPNRKKIILSNTQVRRQRPTVRHPLNCTCDHAFRVKRFYPKACAFCLELIWCFVRVGIKCAVCNMVFHMRCYQSFLNILTQPDIPRIEETVFKSRKFTLQDFNLMHVIGQGGYGKVFMVELKATKRLYAMKVIKKIDVLMHPKCLLNEKVVFETVSNNPFFVSLHSCFQTPSQLIYVMELLIGGNLRMLLKKKQKLSEAHACFYSAEISLALNFLHEHGIIHRDLTLDNVLLDGEGHIKIADYGLCKEINTPSVTQHTNFRAHYTFPPEMLLELDYNFGVDWWALGSLLFCMLTGKHPISYFIDSNNDKKLKTFRNECNIPEDIVKEIILEKKVFVPKFISDEARLVLKGFSAKNTFERLGCCSHTGFKDITTHPFFKSINFTLLEYKLICPPYIPSLETDTIIENFDPCFIHESVTLTPDNSQQSDKINQILFDDFEYVNPLFLN